MLTNLGNYDTITMSKDGKKERKVLIMKTMNIVTMPKGYYVTARYNGMTQSHEYFKTKTAMTARVKELKKMGYVEA